MSKFGREDNRLAGAVVTSLASLLELRWGISGKPGLEGALRKTGHLGPQLTTRCSLLVLLGLPGLNALAPGHSTERNLVARDPDPKMT